MNIALIGYGKMGRRLHTLAPDHNLTVKLVVIGKLNADGASISPEKFESIDMAIDFSHPDGALINLRKLTQLRVPVVMGTTGWITPEQEDEVRAWCTEHETSVLYGSNFSLGVQLFLKLVDQAASLMGPLPGFSAAFHEVHHMEKADAPGGTARTAAELWCRKSHTDPVYGIPASGAPQSESVYLTSQRLPEVIGEHELRIRSPFDDIRISHTALTRDAFANGALKAAGWLKDQPAAFYKIEDVVDRILREDK